LTNVSGLNSVPFMSERSVNRWFVFASILLVGVVTAVIFLDPLTSGQTLFALDYAPYYPKDFGARTLQMLQGNWDPEGIGVGGSGRAFHPSVVLAVLLPPLVYHVAVYIVDTLLVLLASLFFLRGRGVRWLGTVLASLVLAYSGYLFTVIAAGHRSMFDMLPYAIFLFGLVDRSIAQRSLFYFAMIGACMAFGIKAQPDVMGLLCLIVAPYALLRCLKSRPGGMAWSGYLGRIGLGGAVMLLVFLAFGLSVFGHLFAEVVPNRDLDRGGAQKDQWEYATNWSMPPEEMVEFVAPCVYGVDTGNPQGPYWGRVGRTQGWKDHRQGLMNLKQHTIYMGVLQLLFAVYAVVWVIRRRGRSRQSNEDNEGHKSSKIDGGVIQSFGRGEVMFFAVVFLVGLLLALGRYAPFYRLFYAIPFCDKIRAPIKFLHYCEISLAFLFGVGFCAFLEDLKTGGLLVRRRFVGFLIVAGGLATVLLAGWGILHAFRPGLESYWRQLGFGRYTSVMFRTMSGALLHGGLLSVVAACVFGLARFLKRERTASLWAIGLVSVALLLDLTIVARKYVRVRDLTFRYATNPIAENILAAGPCRVSYRIPPLDPYGDFRGSFSHYGVDFLEPGPRKKLSADTRELYSTLSTNVVRLWQLTNTRFIVGESKALESLVKHPYFSVVDTFHVERSMARSCGPIGRGTYSLVEFKAALPKALFYPDWDGMNAAAAWERLGSSGWNPAERLLVEGLNDLSPSGRGPSGAYIEVYRRTYVRVNVDAETDGVLLLNDAYHKDWEVTVDGGPARVLRCNAVMRGVTVPMGQHEVVFRYRPYRWRFIAAMAMCAILLVWAAVRAALGWQKRRGEG
jgi:hypothetical protein